MRRQRTAAALWPPAEWAGAAVKPAHGLAAGLALGVRPTCQGVEPSRLHVWQLRHGLHAWLNPHLNSLRQGCLPARRQSAG